MSYRMTVGIALLAVGLGGVVAAQPPARSVRSHTQAATAVSDAPIVGHPSMADRSTHDDAALSPRK